MRKVQLYIAASLDGYIARKDGGIDWLSAVEKKGEDYGYGEFIASVDATLMGRKTFEQVLSFEGEFPYMGKENYVFSRSRRDQGGVPVQMVNDGPAAFVGQLKNKPGGNIWLIGGGQLNTVLLNAGLIDELILSVIPVILGEGIPLFDGQPEEARLRLRRQQAFDTGLVQLVYERA